MRLSKRGCLSKRGLGGTALMCLCTVWSKTTAKRNVLVRFLVAEERLQHFQLSKWYLLRVLTHRVFGCTQRDSIYCELGGNMERKKKDKHLSFRFMFPFGLLRGPERVLSSSLWLSTPVTCTQTASSSDSFKMHAFATCTSPFRLHDSRCNNYSVFFYYSKKKKKKNC